MKSTINNCIYCGEKPLDYGIANDLNLNGERCFKYVIRCPSCGRNVSIHNINASKAKELCIGYWNGTIKN